jgi:hypothetical protein
MTQGKLYKKIDTLRSLKTTNITKKDTANTGPLNFSKKRFRRAIHPIALIEIEKILDEIKKEFPALCKVKVVSTGEFDIDRTEEYWINCEETLAWFRKWFGDANP